MLAVAALWGSLPPLTGLLLREMDPFLLSACRYSLAVPFIALLARIADGRWPRFSGLPVKSLAALGLCGMAAFSTFYTLSIDWTDPVTGSALSAASPVITAFLVWGLNGTRIDGRTWVGIGFAVVGGLVVALARPGLGGGAPKPQGGEVLMLAAIAAWSWYSMRLGPWLGTRYSVLAATTLTALTASLCLWLIYGVMWAAGLARAPVLPSTPALLQLLYTSALPTALAISLWNFSVGRLGVTVATLLANLTPVFAVVIAAYTGHPATPGQLAGGLIVVAGVLWLQLSPRWFKAT